MAKLDNSLKNMFLSLTVICVVVGAILGWVSEITSEPIAKANAEKQTKAIQEVAPEFDTVGEAIAATSSNGLESTIFEVFKGGEKVGAAIQVTTDKGFSGKITLMFGFNMQGNITGYKLLAHAETPGLGSKIPEWFVEGGKGNVIGKNPTTNNLTVSKDGGEVDAITAATISSRAFCDAIAQAYGVFTNTDVETAATPLQQAAEQVADSAQTVVSEVINQ